MGGTSLFRVGDNVELWRVLLHLSVLVVCLLLFERALHLLEHRAAVSVKYQQLLSKAYRELMILGLIGLGLKLAKEVPSVNGSSATMTAFQVADLTIFILALALILQAVCIFLMLRKHNVQADRAELLSTADLAETVASPVFNWEEGAQEMVRLRLLRHLFLRRFELPELFPFAKYLRQAQNNQITHMTDVSAPMWLLLLVVAWMLERITAALNYGEPALTMRRGLVLVLIGFSWALLLLHTAVFVYFRSCVNQLLEAAGISADQNSMARHLRTIAQEEARAWTQEDAGNALLVMQKMQEWHEAPRRANLNSRPRSNKCDIYSETIPVIDIRYFSRNSWHFTVMMLLMLNGFYLAFVAQCVVYQLGAVYTNLGILEVLAIPIPLVLNTFLLQPQIFRSFVLVSSIFRVDGVTLNEVVNHFREIVELRSEFAVLLWENMQANKISIRELQSELQARDSDHSGSIDVEKMRGVLRACGLHLSSFRFNSVARLLFEIQEMKIDYSQLLKLVTIAQSEELNDTEQSVLIHHHPLLRLSALSDEGENGNGFISNDNSYFPPSPVLSTSVPLRVTPENVARANEDTTTARFTVGAPVLPTHPLLKRNDSKFQGMSSRTLCDLFHLENSHDIQAYQTTRTLNKRFSNV